MGSIDMMVAMVPPEHAKEMAEQIKSQMGVQIDLIKMAIEKAKDEYMANKAERDAASFKVIDTSGDGTLQEQEFLAAFEPESEKNVAFMKALGLSPEVAPGGSCGDCPM